MSLGWSSVSAKVSLQRSCGIPQPRIDLIAVGAKGELTLRRGDVVVFDHLACDRNVTEANRARHGSRRDTEQDCGLRTDSLEEPRRLGGHRYRAHLVDAGRRNMIWAIRVWRVCVDVHALWWLSGLAAIRRAQLENLFDNLLFLREGGEEQYVDERGCSDFHGGLRRVTTPPTFCAQSDRTYHGAGPRAPVSSAAKLDELGLFGLRVLELALEARDHELQRVEPPRLRRPASGATAQVPRLRCPAGQVPR